MKKIKIFAVLLSLVLVVNSSAIVHAAVNSADINSIVSSYISRLSWDDSVPRLNWKVNEASMELLQIIAKELDVESKYGSEIERADDSYISRLSWDDSVPRLDWKVNEASMELLQICAYSVDKYIEKTTKTNDDKVKTNGVSSTKRSKQKITTAKIKTVKASKVKKKTVTIKLNAKTDGGGKLTYKVYKYPKGMKKFIKVNKKGIVTFKKKAKKGTYKITVTAAASGKYKKTTKVISIKVK